MQDIFDQIKQIENQNIDFYNNIPDDEKIGFSPYMLLKWMSYTDDAKQVLHMNGLVNSKVFSLQKHKELLAKLLIASCEKKHHYKWLKRNTKKMSSVVKMISDAHGCGAKEAAEILELYTKQDLLDLCEDANHDKIEIDKIKKEINVLRM